MKKEGEEAASETTRNGFANFLANDPENSETGRKRKREGVRVRCARGAAKHSRRRLNLREINPGQKYAGGTLGPLVIPLTNIVAHVNTLNKLRRFRNSPWNII